MTRKGQRTEHENFYIFISFDILYNSNLLIKIIKIEIIEYRQTYQLFIHISIILRPFIFYYFYYFSKTNYCGGAICMYNEYYMNI